MTDDADAETLPPPDDDTSMKGDARGIFAALLEEVWAERALLQREPVDGAFCKGASRSAVQLPLPGLGARPLFLTWEQASESWQQDSPPDEQERWITREVNRHERRPGPRRRQERMHALRGRFDRPGRAAAEATSGEVSSREETGATRCSRPRVALSPEEELLIVRERRAEDGSRQRVAMAAQRLLELCAEGEDPREAPAGGAVELTRYVLLKPAGALAHLRALDGALASEGAWDN